MTANQYNRMGRRKSMMMFWAEIRGRKLGNKQCEKHIWTSKAICPIINSVTKHSYDLQFPN